MQAAQKFIGLVAIAVATTAYAQVVQVVPSVTYLGPTPYVAPAPVYASPTYYGGTSYSYDASLRHTLRLCALGYVCPVSYLPDVAVATTDLLRSYAPRLTASHLRLVEGDNSPPLGLTMSEAAEVGQPRTSMCDRLTSP
jgi:hypothetical protein